MSITVDRIIRIGDTRVLTSQFSSFRRIFVRLISYSIRSRGGLAIDSDGVLRGDYLSNLGVSSLRAAIVEGNGSLDRLADKLRSCGEIDPDQITYRPPISDPDKIICVGLNYHDHSIESGFEPPQSPTVFTRFASSLVGHGQPIVRPRGSRQLDFECELAAVIGLGGRYIAEEDALNHVVGYAVFNDVSVRDYQFKTPQWTLGKNFDNTGPFGPCLVTADELPPGCRGLRISTRLNGTVVQSSNIDDMIFSVASLISTISEVTTLAPGDVIVTGTPSGVGFARTPPLYMKAGDICEIEVEKVGVLSNCIVEEAV